MAEKKDIAAKASSLRKRAEEIDREKTLHIPENMKNLSPEETKQVLHELRVHQIELEMQNEELRKAHDELDDSRLRYFDLYDLAPVGYCTVSENGLILEANLTAANILNVPRGSLVKTIFSQFILKEDQYTYYLHRKQLLQSAEPHVFELRMVKKDGTVFWAHLVATVANIDGAQVVHVVMSDITSHKEEEELIKEANRKLSVANEQLIVKQREIELSAQLFHGLFDHMTSGAAIYRVINDGSKGSDYVILNFNQAALEIEGKTHADVVGRTLFDLRPNINEYGLISVMKKVWETGEPVFFPVKIYRDEHFSNYYENRVFRLPSGEVVAIYNDVTEQQQAALELKEKIDELQRFHNLTVGRELAMIELKKEVNALLKKSGQEEKYRIVE